MTDYIDQQLVCMDCKESFTWTAGEQAFYEKVGNRPPKRCIKDRALAKAKRQQSQGYDKHTDGVV